MVRHHRIALVSVAALALLAPGARAGVPSPAFSEAPAFIVASPDGAFITNVIVREPSGPIRGSRVEIVFSNCVSFNPCPSPCADCTIDPVARSVVHYTDETGLAAFDLRVGASACPDALVAVRVLADGVQLSGATFASLDQDGDLGVTAADVARVQALLGSLDKRADFDLDGRVTAADVAIVEAHLGASCAVPTSARQSTWGTLKSIYR